VQEFTPGDDEQHLHALVADYLRRPDLKAPANSQRRLISLVLTGARLHGAGSPRRPPQGPDLHDSRRTQDYLLSLLADTDDSHGIVLFSGSNNGRDAQRIYRDWLTRHAGSDRITGSKTADTRAALVEHYRDHGTVMIATEAGAKGINLQFCSLVINYDLPWNPQQVEQRIGRCHRQGQRFDVVVVNFIDRSNDADRRVYQLLEAKFQLFSGVIGASDEVLGVIGSGLDFERRIAEIYLRCRDPGTIRDGFEQLQLDLAGEINEAMVRTRDILLEHFDEQVLERVRDDGIETRGRFKHLFLDLTRAELNGHSTFDADNGFTLHSPPEPVACRPSPPRPLRAAAPRRRCAPVPARPPPRRISAGAGQVPCSRSGSARVRL